MAFHQIAVPHRDILSEHFSSEVYAAKLWDVHNKRGSDEYADAETFFEKTYLTDNLANILNSIKTRISGRGGGHFRSISTPFGGGKTHTLIALYHKCAEWGAKPVVIVGNELDPNEQTLWGAIEEQITGKVDKLGGQVSHGGEALRRVLEAQKGPVLILIDELLQYITRADGIKVNDTTLATLTIAFVQELSEAAGSLDNVCVVVTLPSSMNEQFDNDRFTQLYDKLRKVAGRTKDTITPVADSDIPKIIRQRLFSSSDDEIRKGAESTVKDFVDYCDSEGLIPEGKQVSEYRDDFLNSYPFLPQVIDVLYHRWGTINQFQRTRGVLRLLSLVVSSLAASNKPFISLGDFDLDNDAIKQELVEYLDPQFNSVIAKDITGGGSGASKVNSMVPDKFKGKTLGTRAASAIFMYSHSGGAEINGATESEIKRATCERGLPAAQISEVLNLFRNNLFFLSVVNDRYMLTKEANILKIKTDVMDNLKQRDIDESEKELVRKNAGRAKELRTVIWPANSKDVEDTVSLKLVIMKEDDKDAIYRIYDKVGESDRVRRNTIFFLTPADGEKRQFAESLRSKIAWEKIKSDPNVKLRDGQTSVLASELKKEDGRLDSLVKDYYSVLYVPERDGLVQTLIRPPPVTDNGIDRIVYEHLVENEIISPVIGPITLKKRYLQDRKFVQTSDLRDSVQSVPGELRPANKTVLETSIAKGVLNGEFGLGEMEGDTPTVKFFKKDASASFEDGEVLIHSSFCIEPEQKDHEIVHENKHDTETKHGLHVQETDDSQKPLPSLDFAFKIPEGQVNHISQMLLKIAFHYRDFRLHIKATDGQMSQHDIDMIKETLRQIGAEADWQ